MALPNEQSRNVVAKTKEVKNSLHISTLADGQWPRGPQVALAADMLSSAALGYS